MAHTACEAGQNSTVMPTAGALMELTPYGQYLNRNLHFIFEKMFVKISPKVIIYDSPVISNDQSTFISYERLKSHVYEFKLMFLHLQFLTIVAHSL